MKRVVAGGQVLAEAIDGGDPGTLRCAALLENGQEKRRCAVVLQRAIDGDLVDGVRQHYKLVHPEKGIS